MKKEEKKEYSSPHFQKLSWKSWKHLHLHFIGHINLQGKLEYAVFSWAHFEGLVTRNKKRIDLRRQLVVCDAAEYLHIP